MQRVMTARRRCAVEGCTQDFVPGPGGDAALARHEQRIHERCACGWAGLSYAAHAGQARRYDHGGAHRPIEAHPGGIEVGGPRVQLNCRVDPVLHERLVEAAAERRVTVAWLTSKLLQEALDALLPSSEVKWTTLGSTTDQGPAG